MLHEWHHSLKSYIDLSWPNTISSGDKVTMVLSRKKDRRKESLGAINVFWQFEDLSQHRLEKVVRCVGESYPLVRLQLLSASPVWCIVEVESRGTIHHRQSRYSFFSGARDPLIVQQCCTFGRRIPSWTEKTIACCQENLVSKSPVQHSRQ